jgi:hypothetical protein
MKSDADKEIDEALRWCASILGQVEVVADHSRAHAGQRAAAHRLRMQSGYCYLKLHHDPAHWDSEVYAYEHWAQAFGGKAPKLLGLRAEPPLALVISEIPGRVMEDVQLSPSQQQNVWRAAGQALINLHSLAVGTFFGACRRDGTCAGTPLYDAVDYVTMDFDDLVERSLRGNFLDHNELAIVQAARRLLPAFAGEQPLPIHRDYCPANWLVTSDGEWAGVIDFEFSAWDVRAADFSRYPSWDWISQPALTEAFFDGYGRSFTPEEKQQHLVARVQFALVAIVWGMENAYFGFAADGRQAMQQLGRLLR